MPINPLDTATWRALAHEADELAAIAAGLSQIQTRAAELVDDQRAMLDRVRALRKASAATLNAAADAFTPETPEAEKAIIQDCGDAFSAACARLASVLETATGAEVTFAERTDLDIPARYAAAVRDRLAAR